MRKQKLFEQRRQNILRAVQILGDILMNSEKRSDRVPMEVRRSGELEAVLKYNSTLSFAVNNLLMLRKSKYTKIAISVITISTGFFDTATTSRKLSTLERGLDILIRNWPEVYAVIRDYPLREGEHLYYWLLRTPSRFQQEIAANKRFERQALQNTTIQKLRTLTHATLTDWITGIDPVDNKEL